MQKLKFTYAAQVELAYSGEFEEIKLEVSGTAYEPERGTRDSEGFQVEPDTDGYFEIETVKDATGKEYTKDDIPDDWEEIEVRGYEIASDKD